MYIGAYELQFVTAITTRTRSKPGVGARLNTYSKSKQTRTPVKLGFFIDIFVSWRVGDDR